MKREAQGPGMDPAWVVLAASFLVLFGVWNSSAGFGVFLPVLAGEFGWSRGAISGASSLNLVIGGILAFAVGAASDRYGPRLILALSAFFIGVSLLLASTLTTLWHFYILLGVVMGIFMSGIYLVPAATVSRWFPRQRGLALGILLSGLNLAFVSGPLISAFLISRLGWRRTYMILGVLVWLIALPASVLTRFPPSAGGVPSSPGPSGRGDEATFREALGDRRLWLLVATWFLLGFAQMMVSVHLVAYVKDRGVALESAAFTMMIFGMGMSVGRVLFGMTADRLGIGPTFWVCQVLQIVSLSWIVTGPPLPFLYALVLGFGLGGAGSDTSVVNAASELFGLRTIGATMGILSLGWRCGAGLGPSVAGFLYDATGSYEVAFGLGSAGLAVGLALFTLIMLSRPGIRGPIGVHKR